MSRYNQRFKLRCSACYKKDWADNFRNLSGPTWNNVKVCGEKGDKFICECLTCGHIYESGSKAAYRQHKSQNRT